MFPPRALPFEPCPKGVRAAVASGLSLPGKDYTLTPAKRPFQRAERKLPGDMTGKDAATRLAPTSATPSLVQCALPMAKYWLFKQEPTCYSFADLESEGETDWDGVTNALAQQHLRAVHAGDRAVFYHTGKERAAVGEMEIASEPQPDPKMPGSKAVTVKVRFVRRWPTPVALTTIKGNKHFAGSDLLRLSRLSVVPLTAEQWQQLEKLSGVSTKKSRS
jgi:predicted RNA-binding protein with PUA-like domain